MVEEDRLKDLKDIAERFSKLDNRHDSILSELDKLLAHTGNIAIDTTEKLGSLCKRRSLNRWIEFEVWYHVQDIFRGQLSGIYGRGRGSKMGAKARTIMVPHLVYLQDLLQRFIGINVDILGCDCRSCGGADTRITQQSSVPFVTPNYY